MPSKSEADHIILLLAIIEHTEGAKWNDVAVDTGLYKSGKFVKQAYDAIKKKYSNGAPPAVSTPKSNGKTKSTSKKRASLSEEDDGEATSSKRTKKEASFSKDAEDELAS
ncbi:hypothetical protein LTS08_002207 [Lithohypha guttulata]|nr:hypothetical protein LTS08_002207 [Lithohypha guttulata]